MNNRIEDTIAVEFNRSIWKKLQKAVQQYELIQPGDRIAVCISGGKDSMLLAQCMMRLQRYGKIPFETEFIAMDPGYSDDVRAQLLHNAEILGIPVKLYDTQIFRSADNCGGNPCFLCSRLRRGWLYAKAQELGCGKIALGHHFDDVIETILMGMLYGSQMQTMMPKLHSENYKGVEVIRPLYLVREADIIRWRDFNGLTFSGCACSVTKRSDGSKRDEIKALLVQLRKVNPAVDMNIFRSVENVNLRKIISYHDGDDFHSFLDTYSDGKGLK